MHFTAISRATLPARDESRSGRSCLSEIPNKSLANSQSQGLNSRMDKEAPHQICIWLRACIKLRNGRVARDLALLQGARRENILYGSSTDEQRSSNVKDLATLRAVFWPASGGVAPQSQSALAMLLRRALPAARQKTARPFPIYEMGSATSIMRRRHQRSLFPLASAIFGASQPTILAVPFHRASIAHPQPCVARRRDFC